MRSIQNLYIDNVKMLRTNKRGDHDACPGKLSIRADLDR